MGSKSDFSWTTVILLAAFAILGSFGGGISMVHMVEEHGKWALVGYTVAGGLFIAISTLVIRQILGFLQDK